MIALVLALALGASTASASAISKRSPNANFLAKNGPSWPSSSSPFVTLDNGVHFIMQLDGNFVVYDAGGTALWNTVTAGRDCSAGRCHLQFQGDGNLVLVDYGVSPPKPYWSTATTGPQNTGYLLMLAQSDPYLTVLAPNHDPVYWSTGKNGHYSDNDSETAEGGGGTTNSGKPDHCAGDCVSYPNGADYHPSPD